MKNRLLLAAAASLLVLGPAHSGTASSTASSLNLPILGVPKPGEKACAVVPPEAVDDYVSTTKNTPVTFSPLWNDTDTPDQDFKGFTVAQHGTLVKVGLDALKYTPDAGYVGSDSFRYTLGGCLQCSGSGSGAWCSEPATDRGTVFITVTN